MDLLKNEVSGRAKTVVLLFWGISIVCGQGVAQVGLHHHEVPVLARLAVSAIIPSLDTFHLNLTDIFFPVERWLHLFRSSHLDVYSLRFFHTTSRKQHRPKRRTAKSISRGNNFSNTTPWTTAPSPLTLPKEFQPQAKSQYPPLSLALPPSTQRTLSSLSLQARFAPSSNSLKVKNHVRVV